MAESEDREFDALLAGHADVRAAYRAASVGDEPAAALDAAILAASRKVVKAGPERVDRPARFMRRLAMPLSAAAVMVLATSLSFLVYEERGTPSAPDSSPAIQAPKPIAAPADNADRTIAREVHGTPAEVTVDLPRAKSTSEVRATTRPSPAPMSATPERVGPAPEAPIPAAPSPPAETSTAMPGAPAAARRSDALVDAPGARAPIPTTSDEREAASATRAAEAASERAAARDDRREALRQAEAARAMAPSAPVADRATPTRRAAGELAESTAGAAGVDGAPASGAPMAVEAPAGLVAKRLASPARERATDTASRDAGAANAVPSTAETPAEWIVRVRALLDAGRIAAARAEIARLRCRYPDVTLPPDLPTPEAGAACPSTAPKEGSPDLR